MKHEWSPEATAYLRANYADMSNDDLAAALGISKWAVSAKAQRIGLLKSAALKSALPRGRGKYGGRAAFLDAVLSATSNPRGATVREMATLIGDKVGNVKRNAQRAAVAKHLHTQRMSRETRYFATAELAAASVPLLAAMASERLTAVADRKKARNKAGCTARRRTAGAAPRKPKQIKPATEPKPRKKRENTTWTPERVESLMRDYPTKGPTGVSEALGLSIKCVTRKAHALKIKTARDGKPRTYTRKASPLRKAGSSIRAAAPSKRGPAHLDGPLIFTEQTRRVVCQTPPKHFRSNTHSTY